MGKLHEYGSPLLYKLSAGGIVMRKFNIYSGSLTVGQATVETKGLYLDIKCRCRFDRAGIYKIRIAGDDGQIILGTCIPNDNGYFLEKKVSVRSVGDGELSFFVDKERREDACIACISEDRAFEWIDRLEDCVLIREAGSFSAMLTEKDLTPQGNDPIPEHGSGSKRH